MCRKAGNGKCFAYLWQQTADSLVLVWLLGGLLSLIGALCYAELATAYPREGGDHVYLTETLSRRSGFLFAWTQLRVVRPRLDQSDGLFFSERCSDDSHRLRKVRHFATIAISALGRCRTTRGLAIASNRSPAVVPNRLIRRALRAIHWICPIPFGFDR